MIDIKAGDKIRMLTVAEDRKYLKVGEIYPVESVRECFGGECRKTCLNNGVSVLVQYLADFKFSSGATCGCTYELVKEEGQVVTFKEGDVVEYPRGSDYRYCRVTEVVDGNVWGNWQDHLEDIDVKDSSWHPTYVHISNAILVKEQKENTELIVGDRVVCIKAYSTNSHVVGKTGKVIEKYPWTDKVTLTVVEFDESVGGHSGNGEVHGKAGCVYNFQDGTEYLKRISFREGDKIRFIGDPKGHNRGEADDKDLKLGDIVDWKRGMSYGARNWSYKENEFELVSSRPYIVPKIVIPEGAIKREDLKYGMSVVYNRGERKGWVQSLSGTSARLSDSGWGVNVKSEGYWGDNGSDGWLLRGTAEPKEVPKEKANYIMAKARIGDKVMYVQNILSHRYFLGWQGNVTDIDNQRVAISNSEYFAPEELYLIEQGPKPVYPKRALKEKQVKKGMFVEIGDKRIGEIVDVRSKELYVREQGREDASWRCSLRYDGYWGANGNSGYLLKTDKKYVPLKYADHTKYNVHEYSCTDQNAINLPCKRTGRVLNVDKGTYRKLVETIKDLGMTDRRAIMHLLGRKKKVDTIVHLENSGGCNDTPQVTSEVVANGMSTLVATGRTPVGFSIVREKSTHVNGGDTLVNNLKQWQVWFPNMYVLLIARDGGRYAWYLGKERIDKAEIKVGRKFIVNTVPVTAKGVLPVGTRVVFYSDIYKYGDREDMPLWGGSQGKVAGEVYRSDTIGVHIKWDNGCRNGRFPYDTIALYSEVVKAEKAKRKVRPVNLMPIRKVKEDLSKGIKVGGRVVFFNNSHGYSEGSSNPLWNGTQGKVVGTITNIRGRTADVVWDNGQSNDFALETLKLYRDILKEEKRSHKRI